jgi:hypothetical protein
LIQVNAEYLGWYTFTTEAYVFIAVSSGWRSECEMGYFSFAETRKKAAD